MSDEDVRNAVERLRKLLRAAQYPQLSALHLETGDVSDLLRVLHFVLLDSSRAVAKFLVDKGYDLYGKTDARFVESAFRLLRDEFRCFPSLSATQFLSQQFVARRLALVADAAAAVAHKRLELQRLKRREEAVWSQPQEGNRIKPQVENHVLPTQVTNHAASILKHLKEGGARRKLRRASSETPVQVNDLKEVSPEPTFTGQRADSRVVVHFASESRRSEESVVVDDGVQTESVTGLENNSDILVKAVEDLSRQLNEVSSALLSKMSSVENRLGRLENQLNGVLEEQRELVSHINSIDLTRTAYDDAMPKRPDTTNRALDAESPCAWPPQPAVFERY